MDEEEIVFSPDDCNIAHGNSEFLIEGCRLCMCYPECITRGIIKRYVTFDGKNWHERFVLNKIRTHLGLVDVLLCDIIDKDPKRAMDIITKLFTHRGRHRLDVLLYFNYETNVTVNMLGHIISSNRAREILKLLKELGVLECDKLQYPYKWRLRESA